MNETSQQPGPYRRKQQLIALARNDIGGTWRSKRTRRCATILSVTDDYVHLDHGDKRTKKASHYFAGEYEPVIADPDIQLALKIVTALPDLNYADSPINPEGELVLRIAGIIGRHKVERKREGGDGLTDAYECPWL